MKKHVILTLLCIVLGVIANAQILPNGVYTQNPNYGSFICIKNDTILYNFSRTSWYLGTYQFMDGKYYLNDNMLLGKNAYIEKETCSPDSIEIKCICKYQHFIIDAPMVDSTIYEGESDFFRIITNENTFCALNSTIIFISREQISNEELSDGYIYEESGKMSGFFDYFNIPFEFGTRYVFRQKYFHFKPIMIDGIEKDSDYLRYDKKHNLIIATHGIRRINMYSNRYPYYSPNCDSCITAFKNRFPDLFK